MVHLQEFFFEVQNEMMTKGKLILIYKQVFTEIIKQNECKKKDNHRSSGMFFLFWLYVPFGFVIVILIFVLFQQLQQTSSEAAIWQANTIVIEILDLEIILFDLSSQICNYITCFSVFLVLFSPLNQKVKSDPLLDHFFSILYLSTSFTFLNQ